jgi:2-oxoacid:acceptor oxidoreductase, delta subunit, pyruvate/2-ketoisovalerate family
MAEKRLKTAYDFTWRDMEVGNILTEPGSASLRKTGDWRSERPIMDKEKCNRCGLCWLYCPDAAMKPLDDGYYEPDLYHCKGCGICASVCKREAITMIEEEEK